ncbi:hypothetical protein LCGC14_0221170 [marine sediment metagenome]|uniref:Uncharacterized protein n=1 Tax=marine sediment metagenome TaxID=412755 RepID=A0A0F9UHV1_9ZZZZ
MSKKKTERQKVSKMIVGGLRETIRAHGPITKRLIGSAAKRIIGTLLAKRKIDDQEEETG